MGRGLMAGQRTLAPLVRVRLLPPQIQEVADAGMHSLVPEWVDVLIPASIFINK